MGDSLGLCRRQFLLHHFHLFYDPLTENLDSLQVTVAGKKLLVKSTQVTVLTKGAEIPPAGHICGILPQDHLSVANIDRLDDLVISDHTLLVSFQILISCSQRITG